MEANEIRNMYEVLSTEPAAYANSLAQRAGAAQASLGTLADAVRGASQTAGLGNYTYNRTIRPTVDTLRSSMVAQGMNQWANKLLSDAMEGAKKNYSNAYNAYAKGSGGGGGSGSDAWDGKVKDEELPGNDDSNAESAAHMQRWHNGYVTDNTAFYRMFKKDRPQGMSDDDWAKQSKAWLQSQILKDKVAGTWGGGTNGK